MDSLYPIISNESGLSHLPQLYLLGAGSSQVVSAPSEGVPPAWLRVAIHAHDVVKVSLNSSRSFHIFQCERTICDESTALTN